MVKKSTKQYNTEMTQKNLTKSSQKPAAKALKKLSKKDAAIQARRDHKALIIRRTAKILGFVLAVTYIAMAITILTTQLIPGKYIGVLYLVSTLATAAIVYVQFKGQLKLKTSVILGALSILMIIGNIGLFTAGVVTNNFLSSIQTTPESTEEYSIVALKGRGTKLATPNQTAAFLQSDANGDAVKTEAAKKATTTNQDFDSPTTMTLALQDNTAQLVIFKSSYIQLLKDANNELYGQLEVLATFTVKTTNTGVATNTDVTKPFIMYISGIDTYGTISTVSRSDVNIMVVVNPRTHEVLLVNTPRDYYVQLHGTTGIKDKLTHAGIYGIDTSVATLEDLYNVDINYNVRINFSSLVKVVDALDGVDVESEYNFSAGKTTFVAGTNHLNGEQALTFSRERHAFEGGDRTRGQNQQRVITAIISKLSTPAAAVNFQQVLASISGAFQTNMSSADIKALSRNQLDSLAKWHTSSISVDGTGATDYTYSMGNVPLYVMVPDQASVNSAKSKIQQTLSY